MREWLRSTVVMSTWMLCALTLVLIATAGLNLWTFTHQPPKCPASVYVHAPAGVHVTVTIPGCRIHQAKR